MNHKELVLLTVIAPLDTKTKKQIWHTIACELDMGLSGKIKKTLKPWHALLLLLPIIIFTSFAPNAHTILNARDTGWDATLNKKQLSIKAVSPMLVGKDEVCVLWIKKNNQIFKITELPEHGIKHITLNNTMLANFKHAVVMISIEQKNHTSLPKIIEYKHAL